MPAPPRAKRQKSAKDAPYELIYWPRLPGRGEYIRLMFEESGIPYEDTAMSGSADPCLEQMSESNLGNDENPPPLFPPILRHGDLVIGQSSNIMLYLAPRLGLAPGFVPGAADHEDAETVGEKGGEGARGTSAAVAAAAHASSHGDAIFHLNGLALSALDGLCNETHDTHHPISPGLYYEDQKEPALLRAADYRESRLPKFLAYFEKVLKGPSSGDGPWLYGGRLTYADLVLFQCLDGVKFAFPKATARLEKTGNYDRVFALYQAVRDRPRIKAYLESGRRLKYEDGIYRYYPELDDQE